MLTGVRNVHLLEFNGRFFSPRPDVVVPSLSMEVLHDHLANFTRYGSYIQILQVHVCQRGDIVVH